MQFSYTLVPRLPPPALVAGKSKARSVTMLVGALVGAVVGFVGMHYGMELMLPVPGPKGLKLLSVTALPLVWLVVVGFHELGHLVGGWMGGGTFLLWVVGPFMVRRTPGGIRFDWNRSVNVSGGMAVCLPLDPQAVTPRRAAVMILGGPLASLVLVTLALAIAAWLAAAPGTVSVAHALMQHVALFTAGMSLLIFLVTAAPATFGGFKTDGKRAFELMRGDRRSAQEAALLVLTTASLAGVRPADYDRSLTERAVSLRDGSLFDRYGHLTVYFHAADRGEWAAAQAHLDYALAGADQLVPYIRDVLRCEYAWLLATQTRDVAVARAWLDSAGKLEFDLATRLRAEAAVLLAEGRSAEAAAKAREGQLALEHKSLSPIVSPFAAAALAELLRRATG